MKVIARSNRYIIAAISIIEKVTQHSGLKIIKRKTKCIHFPRPGIRRYETIISIVFYSLHALTLWPLQAVTLAKR